MELILRKGEKGLRQPEPEYGSKYKLYRDGEYLGNGVYMLDEIHGNGFYGSKESNGITETLVYVVDEWEFLEKCHG